MTDALWILMVAHTPWDLRLGAPSVQMQIAAHLRRLGHHVDFLGLHEITKRLPRTRIGLLTAPPFGSRAVGAVRAIAQNYDVIDAHQGNLPMERSQLDFGGLLVTRSAGLAHAYGRFVDSVPRRWNDAPTPPILTRPMRSRQARCLIRDTEASFRASDLILVPNPTEAEELATMGYGEITRVVPNGIPDELLEHAARHELTDVRRASMRRVTAIGTWDLRKGRLDWPAIVPAVRRCVPAATFTFLGTGVSRERVLADLGHPDGVDVVPVYDPDSLPELLSDTKVGALASYVEGFGLGVVEQMACGVPAVAYDVAGPRHTTGAVDADLVSPAGDVDAFSDNLVRVLRMPPPAFVSLASRVRAAADRYRYSSIALETLSAYTTGATGR